MNIRPGLRVICAHPMLDRPTAGTIVRKRGGEPLPFGYVTVKLDDMPEAVVCAARWCCKLAEAPG